MAGSLIGNHRRHIAIVTLSISAYAAKPNPEIIIADMGEYVPRKPSVYIETSVVSYYAARPSRDIVIAGRQEVTRALWLILLDSCECYISLPVLREISQGDPDSVGKRLKAVENVAVLAVGAEAESLAEALLNEGAIPATQPEDVLHIALAATNGIDYLLTWNFAHINNPRLKEKVRTIMERNGYECPMICSPDEFMGGGQ